MSLESKNAYDVVKREALYNILIEFGIPKKFVRLIKMCLNKIYSRDGVGQFHSDAFLIDGCLKQGFALSLLRLNFVPLQCLIFHCRPLSRSSPAQPASQLLRVSVPGAFLRPAGGSCRVENLNSSAYVYHANLQSENCETPVSCNNLLRDFLGLRSNVCPISLRFSSVSTWQVLWGFLSRTEPVSRNLFTSLRTVSL